MQKDPTIFDSYLTLYAKLNSKWSLEVLVKLKTINLLEENIRENLCDLSSGKDFLDMKSKAWSIKENLEKFDFIKTNNLCLDTIKKMKIKP